MNKLLLEFMRENDLDDKLLWKKAADRQMIFVRDDIGEHLTKSPIFVVSTHMSKSCLLPVYAFRLTNGIEFIMRENFYGWVVSIRSPFTIEKLPNFCHGDKNEDGTNDIHEVYCEGFNKSWVYTFKNENFNYSTFRVHSDYDLYVLIYELNQIEVPHDSKWDKVPASLIEACVNQFMERHPSLDSIYDYFCQTYFKANDYDFCKENNLESLHYGDGQIKAFAERVEAFDELGKMFNIEMQKLYWGENFS